MRIDAEEVKIDGNECNVSKKAVVNSAIQSGSCFLGGHPTARLKADVVTGVAPLTVNFDASKSKDDHGIVEYAFQFTNTDFLTQVTPITMFTFTAPGTYMVRVIVKDADGLQARTTRKIVVEAPFANQPPVPTFECWYDAASRNYGCWAEATDPDGFPAFGNYKVTNGVTEKEFNNWSFEDHFEEAGAYTVTFTVTDNLGLDASSQKTLYVDTNIPPVANMNCWQSPEKDAFGCNDESSDEDGYLAEGYFRINGTLVKDLGGSIEYDAASDYQWWFNYYDLMPGMYNVSLTIVDNQGMMATTERLLDLEDHYSDNVRAVLNCQQNADWTISCDASGSSSNDGSIVDYQWEYLDGGSDSGVSILHYFAEGGSGYARLTVYDELNQAASAEYYFDFSTLVSPVINCEIQNGRTVYCNSYASSTAQGVIENTIWNMGDGTEVNGFEISHQYSEVGTYTIKADVYNSYGFSGHTEKTVQVDTLYLGDIRIQCEQSGLSIECQSIIDNSTIDLNSWNYAWFVNGESAGTATDLVTTFEKVGTKKIKVVATAPNGMSISTEQDVTITPDAYPVVEIENSIFEGVYPYVFQASVKEVEIPNGAITRYQWTIGDETFDSSTVEYEFNDSGTYTIALEVEDQIGAVTKISKQIKLNLPANVVINADVISGVAPFDVNFSAAETVDPDGAFLQFEWEFPNLEYAKGEEATYRLQVPGKYYVILNVTDDSGEVAQKTIEIEVLPGDISINNYPKRLLVAGERFGYECDVVVKDGASYEIEPLSLPQGMTITGNHFEWVPVLGEDVEISFKVVTANYESIYNFLLEVGTLEILAQGVFASQSERIEFVMPGEEKSISASLTSAVSGEVKLFVEHLAYQNASSLRFRTDSSDPFSVQLETDDGSSLYVNALIPSFAVNFFDSKSIASYLKTFVNLSNLPICVSSSFESIIYNHGISAYSPIAKMYEDSNTGIKYFYEGTAGSLSPVVSATSSITSKYFWSVVIGKLPINSLGYGIPSVFPRTIFLNDQSGQLNSSDLELRYKMVLAHENNHLDLGNIQYCKGLPTSETEDKKPYLWLTESLAENAAAKVVGSKLVYESNNGTASKIPGSHFGEAITLLSPLSDDSSKTSTKFAYLFEALINYFPEIDWAYRTALKNEFETLLVDPEYITREFFKNEGYQKRLLNYFYEMQNLPYISTNASIVGFRSFSNLMTNVANITTRDFDDINGKRISFAPLTGRSFSITADDIGSKALVRVSNKNSNLIFSYALCKGTSPQNYSDCTPLKHDLRNDTDFDLEIAMEKDKHLIFTIANYSSVDVSSLDVSISPEAVTVRVETSCDKDEGQCVIYAVLSGPLIDDYTVSTSLGDITIPAGAAIGEKKFSPTTIVCANNEGTLSFSYTAPAYKNQIVSSSGLIDYKVVNDYYFSHGGTGWVGSGQTWPVNIYFSTRNNWCPISLEICLYFAAQNYQGYGNCLPINLPVGTSEYRSTIDAVGPNCSGGGQGSVIMVVKRSGEVIYSSECGAMVCSAPE